MRLDQRLAFRRVLLSANLFDGRFVGLGPVERGFYRLAGVKADSEQHWTAYAAAMLVLNTVLAVVFTAAAWGLRRGRAARMGNAQRVGGAV